jgi:hypothetical protein
MAKIIAISLREADKELWTRFIATARREGKSASQMIAEWIREYLARHGEGNPAIPLDRWAEKPDFIAFPTLGELPNPVKLRDMPEPMLAELRRNAEAYASVAGGLIHARRTHQTHVETGVRDGACPYCREEE